MPSICYAKSNKIVFRGANPLKNKFKITYKTYKKRIFKRQNESL